MAWVSMLFSWESDPPPSKSPSNIGAEATAGSTKLSSQTQQPQSLPNIVRETGSYPNETSDASQAKSVAHIYLKFGAKLLLYQSHCQETIELMVDNSSSISVGVCEVAKNSKALGYLNMLLSPSFFVCLLAGGPSLAYSAIVSTSPQPIDLNHSSLGDLSSSSLPPFLPLLMFRSSPLPPGDKGGLPNRGESIGWSVPELVSSVGSLFLYGGGEKDK